MRLHIARIEAATKSINPVFQHTPQYVCESLSKTLGCRIVLKVETLNPVRSFKGRGADRVLSKLQSQGKQPSVVCASAGNLGQALAYCGRLRGFDVTVTASRTANALKLNRMRMFGANLILVDGQIEAALALAKEHSRATAAFLVEDSQNVDTCEGAGTIGLELSDFPQPLDAILIPLGAGAMVTGVGYALKSRSPQSQVISVQPENAPAMTLSYRSGRVVDPGPPNTIADGVAGRLVLPEVLSDMLEVVDETALVSEESIKEGIRLLYLHAGLLAEPSAALGLAAIIEGRERFAGMTVGVIVCGSNIVPGDFYDWTTGNSVFS